MVWFQCEDCGENLKKPKLANHFRICSSNKLSCIDCGQIFGRQSVQGHTQCVTEAEKYGPKGQSKAANGTSAKSSNEKKKLDVDINVGLSSRPPWFCSLCNTKATSQQTLLLHADGKKHWAKARAFHAKNQPAKPIEESTVANGGANGDISKSGLSENKENVENNQTSVASDQNNSASQNINLSLKKRKADGLEGDDAKVTVIDPAVSEETGKRAKKVKNPEKGEVEADKSDICEEGFTKKLKWKKLISSALKSAPDSALKMKKLRKLVSKSLKESDIVMCDTKLLNKLEHQVKSSSKFVVDGKHVRLAS